MFTGIIQEVGTVVRILPRAGAREIAVRAAGLACKVEEGDSVCVSGACLTATWVSGEVLEFDVGAETEKRTTLGSLRVGGRVNLEPAAAAGAPLGGHFVNGHVDGVGRVALVGRRGDTVYLTLFVPQEGARYVVPRGSIAVDGVSLTPTDVEGGRVSVALIPYTLENTTLGSLRIGQEVNVEFDILAKYAAAALGGEAGLTLAALEENGF